MWQLRCAPPAGLAQLCNETGSLQRCPIRCPSNLTGQSSWYGGGSDTTACCRQCMTAHRACTVALGADLTTPVQWLCLMYLPPSACISKRHRQPAAALRVACRPWGHHSPSAQPAAEVAACPCSHSTFKNRWHTTLTLVHLILFLCQRQVINVRHVIDVLHHPLAMPPSLCSSRPRTLLRLQAC